MERDGVEREKLTVNRLIWFQPSLVRDIDEVAWQRRNRSWSDVTRQLLRERLDQIKAEQSEDRIAV